MSDTRSVPRFLFSFVAEMVTIGRIRSMLLAWQNLPGKFSRQNFPTKIFSPVWHHTLFVANMLPVSPGNTPCLLFDGPTTMTYPSTALPLRPCYDCKDSIQTPWRENFHDVGSVRFLPMHMSTIIWIEIRVLCAGVVSVTTTRCVLWDVC